MALAGGLFFNLYLLLLSEETAPLSRPIRGTKLWFYISASASFFDLFNFVPGDEILH